MTAPDFDSLLAAAAGRRFAFIVGWPVSHSRSPLLHGFWLKERRIDGCYGRLAVEPGGAALRATFDFIRRTPQARGCNLTLPHKIDALELLDVVTPAASRIGAVNTVVKRADGTLEGRNTDGFGFVEALRAGAPAWQPAAAPAVVLGAGGAARAVIAALVDAGVPELRLVNRTRQAAIDLGVRFTPDDGRTLVVDDWSRRAAALAGAGLLVNTTSLGMDGQPALDLALEALPTAAVVNDVVYVPLRTDLLRRAQARGNPTVDGLDMLLHQGRPGFAAWFGGSEPAVTPALRTAVAGDLGA
ncbi:shikimate dehydrogenase [Vineibacter terrae]|uniref:Shikimate dehydrogenase (NADP(+)) n=1 Tax=Vineibacter terrae TaxID=2586908 RepID=A0A5C8P6H9_9HYPH|nr:shikimate dehydrogenase [Vineibacter terrae]TXL69222.1 shikimate dehydrogenase [Vineibacter terrae]